MIRFTEIIKKLQIILLLFIFCIFHLSSQTVKKYDQLGEKFYSYEVHTIASNDIYSSISLDSRNNFVTIPFSDGTSWQLEMYDSGIISQRYQLVSGTTNRNRTPVKAMSGKLVNVANSSASLTFNDGFIYGYVRIGLTTYFIEPITNFVPGHHKDEFVVYSINDIIPDKVERKCGFELYEEELMKHQDRTTTTNPNRSVGECFIVDYAIAADWSMVTKYGSDIAVENQLIGVTNNVQTNYDNEFADELQLEIPIIWITPCSTCNPWTNSTDSGALLSSFRSWGNGGGFGTIFDVASLWTNRDFDGSTIGLAYVGVVCTNSRYNVLQDFSSNANFLRVLTSHELGHNFNANHDGSGSGFIMAPAVNTSNTWSTASITAINQHISTRTCLSDCPPTVPPPVADFDFVVNDDCIVGQVQFFDQSSNAFSRVWSFPGGNPSTSTAVNPIISYQNVGVYSATLTVTNPAGTNTRTRSNIFTINTVPVASFTFFVNGAVVIFGNTSVNATSYSWDFGDGQFSTEINPTHTYTEDGTYNVILTAFNDCGGHEYIFPVTIATPPIADFSASPLTGCAPLQVSFVNGATNNTTNWQWTFEGGNPATSNAMNPNVIYNQIGNYGVTLTVSNAQGSDVIVRQNYINIVPDALSSFTYVKTGNTVEFTNTSTNSQNYLWNFGDGNSSTATNPTHTYATTGTYIVTLNSSNDCSDNTSSQTINLSTSPIAGIGTSNSPEGCASYTIDFISTSENNPTSYAWTFEGGSPATSSAQNPTVVYNNTGSFDVQLIVTNALGADTLFLQDYVLISTIPQGSFNFIKDGLDVTFVNNIQNADSYLWDFGDNNSSTEENPLHTYDVEGIYNVILTSENSCGSSQFSQTVSIILPPVAGFTVNTATGCDPLEVQFTNSSSPNTTQWQWTFPGGNPSSSTLQNPLVTYGQSGQYDVTLIVSNAAGQDQMINTDYITVNTIPTSAFDLTMDGNIINVTNTGLGATTTEWNINNGVFTFVGQSLQYLAGQNGSYTIQQTNSNDCGSASSVRVVNVNVFPVASFSVGDQNNCAPATITFTNTSINTEEVLWTFEGGTPTTSTELSPSILYSSPGTYNVELRISNQYGENTTTRTIEIIDVPQASFGSLLNAATVTFNNTTPGSNNTFSWNFGDGNSSTQRNPSHTYGSAGEYVVVLTATNQCGSKTIIDTILIDDRFPSVAIDANLISGCAPLTVEFEDQSTNNPTTWNWTFEGGNPTNSTEQNPVVVYENEGVYPVSLRVTNDFGTSTLLLDNYIIVYGTPTASFDISLDDGSLDCNYTGNLVSNYLWDFGDGNTSNEKSPSHRYSKSGDFNIVLIVSNDCGSDTISRSVNVTLSSVNNILNDKNVVIVPNPSMGIFTIKMQNAQNQKLVIYLTDMMGREINKWSTFISQNAEDFQVDATNLPSGQYLVRIINQNNEIITKKVVIIE